MTRSSNSTPEQRSRILARLRTGPMSTLVARSELDVMHPAARVLELRDEGYCIETVKIDETTPCGEVHSVGCYVLMPTQDQRSLPLPLRMLRNPSPKKSP